MLQKIVSDFIRYAESRRSPRLVSVYRTMGRRFCAFAEERKRRSLGEVKNLEFLQDFLRFLSSFRPRSPYSAHNNGVEFLRDLFDYSIAAGHLPPGANPARRIRYLPRPRRPIRTLSQEDFDRLLEAARKCSLRDAALIVLLGRVGLKTGEVADLAWADIVVSAPPVFLRVSSGPRSKRRVLPLEVLGDAAVEILRQAKFQAQNEGGTIFPSSVRSSRVRHIQFRVGTLGRAAGFSFHLTPQVLRDTAAVYLLSRIAPEDVARYLGYTPAGMGEFRQRYARHLPASFLQSVMVNAGDDQ